jgi:methionine biosynthesis protein MetW
MLKTPDELLRNARPDHLLMAEMVEKGSRVLDVGCGDGSLLRILDLTRGVDGRGVEISRERVNTCVAQGLSVIQGDADKDLTDYPDDAFDYAILSLTIQATSRPKLVLEQLLRIGRRAIISLPNFGHWRIRTRLLLTGRMPNTDNLPDPWYESPNIHLCTITDFVDLCEMVHARVERSVTLDSYGRPYAVSTPLWVKNLVGKQAVFLLKRGGV